MGFEMPNLNNQPMENEEPVIEAPKKEEPDRLKNVKKIAGIVALGATVLATEGCDNKSAENSPKQDESKIVHVERSGGGLKAQYEIGQKILRETMPKIFAHEADIKTGKITQDNIENDSFLKSYYDYVEKQGAVPDGGNQMVKESNNRIFMEGATMRALWHAWLNGVDVDLSKGLVLNNAKFVGNVLVSAELNGQNIPINPNDFTDIEKGAIDGAKNISGNNADESINQQTTNAGGIKTSPDFDKDASF